MPFQKGHKFGIKHGDAHSRLYRIWCHMRNRCFNKNTQCYKNYGGRGITVCQEWLEWINFKNWALLNNYKNNLWIDRINSNDNYCPSNCRWVTPSESGKNGRWIKLTQNEVDNIRKKYIPRTYSMPKLAKEYKVGLTTIFWIIHNITWTHQ